MKNTLLLIASLVFITSCENETPQFKAMQYWYKPPTSVTITAPPTVTTPTPVQQTDYFQITTFGEYYEVANFDITAAYIDDDKSMIAVSYTDGDADFHIYLNLETEKYMLVWGGMPLANDWPDAFFSYSGTVDITNEYVKLNISNPTINIQGQTYKGLQVTNLIN